MLANCINMIQFVCILFAVFTGTASATVAPGDEDQLCTETLPAAGILPRPVYPTNIKVLMDSYNYDNLLPPQQNPVWQQVDLDDNNPPGIATNWIQQGSIRCRGAVFVCGFGAGAQNNWLITQLINRTVDGVRLQQVSVQIQYELEGCEERLQCQRLFEVHKYETSAVNTTAARDITNYELVRSVAPSVASGLNQQNDTVEISFDTEHTSFYLAIRDVTSCILISRLLIFYTVCPSETSDLSLRTETIAPVDNTLLQVPTQCVPIASVRNSGGSNQTTSVCSQGGIWTVLSGQECQCNQGFVASEDKQSCIESISEALTVKLINQSPRVVGGTITAEIETNKPIKSLSCAISGFPTQDCSSGTVTFTDVPPRIDTNRGYRAYIFRIVARATDGERVVFRRPVYVEQEGFCGVHFINEGVRVVGDTALVEFTGVGQVESFYCKLDDERLQPCSSPWSLTGLSEGEHRVKIVPSSKDCHRRSTQMTFVV